MCRQTDATCALVGHDVEHGEWLQWIEDHLDFGEHEARHYMTIARNRERVRDLGITTIRGALASIKQAKDGDMADLDSDFECEIDAIVERQRAAQVKRYERKATQAGVIGKLPTETPDLWKFISTLNSAGMLSPQLSVIVREFLPDGKQAVLKQLSTLELVELLAIVRLHSATFGT
jgi:hypothetical protein